jgi:hypothetical protein
VWQVHSDGLIILVSLLSHIYAAAYLEIILYCSLRAVTSSFFVIREPGILHRIIVVCVKS